MLDHSLSEADSTAVKIVRGHGGASRARGAHALHAAAAGMSMAARRALHINAAASGMSMPQLKGMDKGMAGANPAVSRMMKKLRAVKAYAQGFQKGELEAEARESLHSGRTHQLVQNSPLVGAVFAHHGELVNDEPRYAAADIGLKKVSPASLPAGVEV